MVAPIDAKATFQVEGEEITLRLNFRSLALAEAEGIDVMSRSKLTAIKSAVLLRCLAVQDKPGMTDEEAFAIIVRAPKEAGEAIGRLFATFGGKASAEGNAPKAKAPA